MVRVSTAGWKPTREAVAALVGQVKSAVEVDKPDCVVFFLLDNLQYLWRMLDGTTTQQQSDGRGKFHMEGELTIANKEVQLNIYKLVKPVLQAAGERPFVVITPMGRYLSAPCCEKESHITNFRSENYEEGLLANLEEVKKNFRGFLFSDNIRKTLVLDLGPVLEKLGKEVCWGADPVHPSKAVYCTMIWPGCSWMPSRGWRLSVRWWIRGPGEVASLRGCGETAGEVAPAGEMSVHRVAVVVDGGVAEEAGLEGGSLSADPIMYEYLERAI